MRGLRTAIVLVLLGCGATEAPYVVLRIEDPKGLGAGSTMLVITDASGNSTQLAPAATGFPMTLTLTSERRGSQSVTVDVYAAATAVAHGAISIDFAVVSSKTVPLVLDTVCDKPGGCPQTQGGCTSSDQCDDGVYCNGLETCGTGQCLSGSPPCPASPYACVTITCNENTDSCTTATNDSVCQNPETPTWTCDANHGCVAPPLPCAYPADCDDGLVCNGTETCVNSVCQAGTPPTQDMRSNDCAPAMCDERYGVGTRIVPDGTACTTGGALGTCQSGECALSPPSPCTYLVNPAHPFSAGITLGGTGKDITVDNLHFPVSDAAGFLTTWEVYAGEGGSDGEIGPFIGNAYDQQFAFFVKSPMRIVSMRVRSNSGRLCHIDTQPTTTNATFIQSTQPATITLEAQAILSGEQPVRFVIDCGADTAATFRVVDVCLENRPN